MLDSTRTRMLIGDEDGEKLRGARVAVFGIGGVGSAAAEAAARAGVGHITLVDADVISPSNCNRQIVALSSNIGKEKVLAMKDRILDINSECEVTALRTFFDASTAGSVDLSGFDAVIDAIDTVTSKLLLIESCVKAGIYVVSSMGTGNKLHPEMLRLADIKDTKVCPLA
ncbi:MAG: ThiF family adenylyltransferase, partial [Clostridia bacterium]|nr:ThiF family adenylyltransferase [Clostridia bacterium]